LNFHIVISDVKELIENGAAAVEMVSELHNEKDELNQHQSVHLGHFN